jgi:hypothetical protein
VIKLVRKLTAHCEMAQFRCEAGRTGYGLDRQIVDLGRSCRVVAPSLIPSRPGKRVETNRCDAQTAVCAPDETHEAARDLVPTRGMARSRPGRAGCRISRCNSFVYRELSGAT